ncbi:hypothetical protein [Mycolicibacterium fallax]|nr:hypothetical protein [Mycolicibacterium fallax]BBY97922.1 hypothetical protein MFAL_13890 [Mycolicibacterium fallax]
MAGNHPFLRGHWTGPGDQPDALTLAKTGQWAGGPRSQLHTHPLAPPVTFLPPDIQRLFVRAFTDGANNPNARPTATEWREALTHIQTTECPRGHQIPAEADPCPWCTIDNERTNRRQQRATPPISTGQVAVSAKQIPAAPVGSNPLITASPARPASAPGRTRTPVIAAAVVAGLVAVGLVAFLGARMGQSNTSSSSSYRPDNSDSGYTATTSSPTYAPPSGDLGLSQPISRPECDGSGVVILGSVTTPGAYASGVQRLLNAHPGAYYLKTDVTCPSLRPRTPEGNLIYAVYTPAGRTQSEICAAVRRAGGDSYGKWLDRSTDPSYIIPC